MTDNGLISIIAHGIAEAQGDAYAEYASEFDGYAKAAVEAVRKHPAELGAYSYDRGRRDILNAILALNPVAAQKRHIINGGTEETFSNHEGKLPFDVVFWVCEVAAQLGIRSTEEMEDEVAK